MLDLSAFLDRAAAHDHCILNHSALLYLDARKEHRVLHFAVNAASVGDHTVLKYCLLADTVSCHTAVSAVDAPVIVKQVDAAVLRVKHLHISLPERRNRIMTYSGS